MFLARRQSFRLASVDLAGRSLVVVGVVVVLATIAIAASLIVEQRARTVNETQQAAAGLARVMAEQTSLSMSAVDLALRGIRTQLTAIAAKTGDVLPDVMRSKGVFDMLLEEVKGIPQVAALGLVGADGRVLNSSRGIRGPAPDLADRDYFRHFLNDDDHSVFVSSPVTNRTDGVWSVLLARRIGDPQGNFAGVVFASIRLSDLEDFYKVAIPADSTVTLLRADGTVLVHIPHDEQQIGVMMPSESLWYSRVGEGGGSYHSPGYLGGIGYFISAQPLRDFPLVVDVGTAEKATLIDWRHRAMWMAAVAVIITICEILLLRLLGAHLRRLTASESSLARKNAELETSRMQFNAALDNISQGVTFFDAEQNLIVCNRRYREIFRLAPEQTREGTSLAEIIGHRIACGSFPEITQAQYLARRTAFAAAKKPFDVIDALRDGRVVSLHYEPLATGGWVTTHEDITERRRTEADLAFMARHDALTGLPNRMLFQERVEQAIATARRQFGCALICVDLDAFKVINDTLGHLVGDGLLRAVAGRLSAAVRDVDTVARLGGDEFAIVQAGLDNPEHAAVLAERIIGAIGQPFDVDGHRVTIGASIGIAMVPADGTSYDMLLRNADIALYLAKGDGRGTYRLFEPEMDAMVQGRRRLELDLRAALSMDSFALHYQPYVDVASGRVAGFEALIRWHHPVRGIVSPVDFIPIAEDTGLIVPIGRWVLRTACQEAMSWPADIGLAVNLSAVQFRGGRLCDTVQDALTESGLAPGRLELEITESVLLQHSDDSLSLLHQLRAMGVRIALDDFGTGYSSLSYLRGFRFDKIKIDRSFIGDLTTNRDSRVIVGAVIGLAVGLGITITAEGVETPEQLAILRNEGCVQVQGRLFSMPLPADDAAAALQLWRGREARRLDQSVV